MSKIDIEQLAQKITKDSGYNFDYPIGQSQIEGLLMTMYQKATEAQKRPAMSLEECKDVVAKKRGHDGWFKFSGYCYKSGSPTMEGAMKEVSELYAKSCCEAQRIACVENAKSINKPWHPTNGCQSEVDKQSILETPLVV